METGIPCLPNTNLVHLFARRQLNHVGTVTLCSSDYLLGKYLLFPPDSVAFGGKTQSLAFGILVFHTVRPVQLLSEHAVWRAVCRPSSFCSWLHSKSSLFSRSSSSWQHRGCMLDCGLQNWRKMSPLQLRLQIWKKDQIGSVGECLATHTNYTYKLQKVHILQTAYVF